MPFALPVKKTDLARALAEEGRHPMKAIADTMGVHRSYQYQTRRSVVQGGRRRYPFLIREIVDARTAHGYRRVTALLSRRCEEPVNHKRVYRIMKMNGLLLQRHTGRPVKVVSDAFEIVCWNGERVRVAFSLDCCDREIMNYVGTTGGICGSLVRDIITEVIEYRFGSVDRVPTGIQRLSDSGPAFIARETWRFAGMRGLDVCTTPYYSPESNGMAESFVKTFKRDYVHVNLLRDAKTVLEQIPHRFNDYNEHHPHKGLKAMPPGE